MQKIRLVLLAVLVMFGMNKHRQRRTFYTHFGMIKDNNDIDDPFKKVREYSERKVGMIARINVDPQIKNIMNKDGLTSNYNEMLNNPNSYVILRKNPEKKIDLNKKIVIGYKPSQQGLGYSYGEVDQDHDFNKLSHEREYTNDFNEMLANPSKKMLILGLHPQLNTPRTRTITPQMEDPIIQISKEEKEQEQKEYEQRLQQKQKEIQEYLDAIHKSLIDDAQQVSPNQIKIVKNIKDYIMEAGDSGPVQKFQQLIDQILNIFTLTHPQSKKDPQSKQADKQESQNDSEQENHDQNEKDQGQTNQGQKIQGQSNQIPNQQQQNQPQMQAKIEPIQSAGFGSSAGSTSSSDSSKRFKLSEQNQQKTNNDSNEKSEGMKQIENMLKKNGVDVLDSGSIRFSKQSIKNIKQLLEDQQKLKDALKENQDKVEQMLNDQKQNKSIVKPIKKQQIFRKK